MFSAVAYHMQVPTSPGRGPLFQMLVGGGESELMVQGGESPDTCTRVRMLL
jgi:hypothetical protein